MKRGIRNNKAQAVLELAIFGALILFGLGILLSFAQQMNQQQYVRMEAFRRALYHGCTNSLGGSGAGSSVQYILMQNRRFADASNNFRKGSPQVLSGGASVSWAVPRIEQDAKAARLTITNINGQEQVASYRSFVPAELDHYYQGEEQDVYQVFRIGDISMNSTSTFEETTEKDETPSSIVVTRNSQSVNQINPVVKYEMLWKDEINDRETFINEDVFFEANQTLVESHTSQWETDF